MVGRWAVRRVAAIAMAASLCAGDTSKAEEPSALDWLASEPVTLFDLGVLRLQQEMDQAARWLVSSGYASGDPWSGAYYEWRTRRVVAYMTVRERVSEPSEAACREVFRRLQERLTSGVPAGTRSAEFFLERLFMHPGLGNYGRPRRLGEDLVDMVQFEVTLLPPPPVFAGGRKVHCAGTLSTTPEDLAMTTQ